MVVAVSGFHFLFGLGAFIAPLCVSFVLRHDADAVQAPGVRLPSPSRAAAKTCSPFSSTFAVLTGALVFDRFHGSQYAMRQTHWFTPNKSSRAEVKGKVHGFLSVVGVCRVVGSIWIQAIASAALWCRLGLSQWPPTLQPASLYCF